VLRAEEVEEMGDESSQDQNFKLLFGLESGNKLLPSLFKQVQVAQEVFTLN